MSVAWKYQGNAREPFSSPSCGTSVRLPNGNTIITETNKGRAFEVTMEGKIVWEFYNPHLYGVGNRKIAGIDEMVRLPPDFPLDWLEPAADK